MNARLERSWIGNLEAWTRAECFTLDWLAVQWQEVKCTQR